MHAMQKGIFDEHAKKYNFIISKFMGHFKYLKIKKNYKQKYYNLKSKII